MGLFLLPLFSFFIPRKFTFWVKYAGNWAQEKPPLSYRIQRWWLQKNIAKCNVTINGFWENQPVHCLSFENPCLTQNDIEVGEKVAVNKSFETPFELIFIGRLDASKGIDKIITALKQVDLSHIKKIHFVGDGPEMNSYKKQCEFMGDKANFHGFLEKKKVHELLMQGHFLLLPSDSEGFPKVIAEAACYGVVPVVSSVGSISHYVNENNGFLWDISSSIVYTDVLTDALNNNAKTLKDKSNAIVQLAEKFTFTNYLLSLSKILSKSEN